MRAPAERMSSPWSSFSAEGMAREGLVWEHGPNVSAGANSADSHYEPTVASSKPIRTGDFVLIDIWGKVNRPDACYYDITWTGVVGREPTAREQMVFETVRNARDAAVNAVKEAFARKQSDRRMAGRRRLPRRDRTGRARGLVHAPNRAQHRPGAARQRREPR